MGRQDSLLERKTLGLRVLVGGKTADFQWRDNNSFQDVLTFTGFSRGRSAARGVFHSKTHNCPVEMFLTDLTPDMKLLVGGRLEGTFHFCKRGQNFGIQRVA